MKAMVSVDLNVPEDVVKKYTEIKEQIKEIAGEYGADWNPYSNKIYTKAADDLLPQAVSKLDNSMKGWKPTADGKETFYSFSQISNTITYTRNYTK